MLSEIAPLRRPDRTIVVYHHQTRRKGGHMEELRHLGSRLSDTGANVAGALRASPWSPRAFFLLDADAGAVEKAKGIAATWANLVAWHPHL
jgi:hypothetical protein